MLGATIVELLLGRPAQEQDFSTEAIADLSKVAPKGVIDLIQICLDPDPTKRPSAKEGHIMTGGHERAGNPCVAALAEIAPTLRLKAWVPPS